MAFYPSPITDLDCSPKAIEAARKRLADHMAVRPHWENIMARTRWAQKKEILEGDLRILTTAASTNWKPVRRVPLNTLPSSKQRKTPQQKLEHALKADEKGIEQMQQARTYQEWRALRQRIHTQRAGCRLMCREYLLDEPTFPELPPRPEGLHA